MQDTATEPSPAAAPAAEPEARPRTGTGLTIARNSMWLMVDSLAAVLSSLYCSITVARTLGPDLMGHYNYVLYFATVLKLVSEVAIPATLRKFTAEFVGRGDYGTVKTLVHHGVRLLSKLSGAAVVVGLVVVFMLFAPDQKLVGSLAVLSIVPATLLSTPTGALVATENLRHIVVASLGGIAANVMGVTVSLLMGWGLVGLTASLLVSRVVDCSLRFVIFRRVYAQLPGQAERGPMDPSLRGRMIRFAAHQLLLVLLYAFLFDRMEVFFLKSLAPAREIAFFSISFTLVSYLLQIPLNLAGSAQASVWVQQGRSPEEAVRTTATATWFVMLIAAPALLGVAALSDPLLRLMYGAKYLPAIPVLTVLAITSLGLAISQPTQYLLVGAERQGFYIAWLCLAGVVDVGTNLLLIPAHGALGAALAKGASGVFGAIGFLTYLAVRFRARLPYGRMAKLLLACVAMFACVRLLGRPLTSLLALVLGIPVGAAVFFVLARWLRLLDQADRERLRRLDRLVPSPARGSYLAVVEFLVPA
jgi:O-antigen/teichoic acid export membrane protein